VDLFQHYSVFLKTFHSRVDTLAMTAKFPTFLKLLVELTNAVGAKAGEVKTQIISQLFT